MVVWYLARAGRLSLTYLVLWVAWQHDPAAVRVHGPWSLLLLAAVVWALSAAVWKAFRFLLRVVPGLHWAIPLAGVATIVVSQSSPDQQWLWYATLSGGGLCFLWLLWRGDGGAPIPSGAAALTRAVGRIVVSVFAFAMVTGNVPGLTDGSLWPGFVLGGVNAVTALVAGTVTTVMMPRYGSACIVNLEGNPGLVYGAHGHIVYVRDLVTGKERAPLGTGGVLLELWDLAFDTVLSSIRLRTKSPLTRFLPGLVHAVCPIRTADGQQFLASAGDDEVVHVWDLASETRISALRGVGAIHALCEVPLHPTAAAGQADSPLPGTVLLACGGDQVIVKLWDPVSGRLVRALRTGGFVRALCTFGNAGSTLLAVGGAAGVITIWRPDTGALVCRIQGHNRRTVTALCAVDIRGQVRLASAGEDGTISVWDPITGDLEHRKDPKLRMGVGQGSLYAVCALKLDGTSYLCAGGDLPAAFLWSPETGQIATHMAGFFGVDTGWYRAMCTTEIEGSPRAIAVGYSRYLIIFNPHDVLASTG